MIPGALKGFIRNVCLVQSLQDWANSCQEVTGGDAA